MTFEVTVCTQWSEGKVRYVKQILQASIFFFFFERTSILGNRNEPERVVVLFAEALDLLQCTDDQTDGG